MSTQRQPKGIPVGGQFAANSHDEAGASLGVKDDLMEIGESRTLPHADIEVTSLSVDTDENGIDTITATLSPDPWGHERDLESDDERVTVLSLADGITGTATRVEATNANDPGNRDWQHYEYDIKLHNPRTNETITQRYSTGLAHERTPRAADVLHTLVMDGSSVHGGKDIQEWYDEYGYEIDEDAQWEREDGDMYHRYRGVYDACVKMDEQMQDFLGDRYEAYLYGDEENVRLQNGKS